MKYSRLWPAATIIALIVIVGFVVSVPRTRDVDTASPSGEAVGIPTVSLRDSFKKGVHTITGSFEAPNACATVTAQAAFVPEASGEGSIVVALSVPEDSGVCLQVPTRVNFTTTVSAPARLPITATVNGAPATTTVS